MSAPTGNTNAIRWTSQQTHAMLDQVEELAWDETIHTLTHALLKLKCYKQVWSYWKRIWALEGNIMDRIYYIEQIFIHKLEEAALFKRLNVSACFFILRHNYGYDSKAEPELPSHLIADLEAHEAETAASQAKDQSAQTTGQKTQEVSQTKSLSHPDQHKHINKTETTTKATHTSPGTNFAFP